MGATCPLAVASSFLVQTHRLRHMGQMQINFLLLLRHAIRGQEHPRMKIAARTGVSRSNILKLSQYVVKEHPDVWLHIDAAWAGVALACPEYREPLRLPQINEFATSFCTNFHKVVSTLPKFSAPLKAFYLVGTR